MPESKIISTGKYPVLENEADRLAALHSYHILDTAEEKDFDDLTTLAAIICGTPVALVSLVDKDRQWFKSHKGIPARETPRDFSFCAHAIASPEHIMIVPDAKQDERFSDNPLVTGELDITFYAGVPLVNSDGFALGSLCVIDQNLKTLSQEQIDSLMVIARQVVDKLELRRKIMQLEEANSSLDSSEARFRDLVNQAPVAITIYNGTGLVIEQANECMLSLLGQGPGIIGQPLLKARPELAGHPYLDVIYDVIKAGKDHVGYGIKAPVRSDGEVIEGYFDVTYKPLKDDGGKVTGVMVVATDVTEKTLARQREIELNDELAVINEELTSSNEELSSSQDYLLEINHSLEESEARFRNLIMQSPVAIASLKGRELTIDCANEMILKIWGKDNSVLGKPLYIALPELEGQPFLQILDDVYTSGKLYFGNEAKVTLEQGSELTDLFLNFVYQPIYGGDGATTDIMVVANDVTEQVNSRLVLKEKNEALSLLAEQLAYVSNAIPQQVWTATPEGMLDFVNEQTVLYFGKEAGELMGANWIKVVHPDDLEDAGKAWAHSLSTGDPYQTEFRLLSKNDTYVWHLARAAAFIEDGKIVKWFGTNTDIDGHKQLERHKTDFISIASHELKTPITSLKASLQLLDRIKHQPLSPMLPKLIEQSNRGLLRINSLIDDLLSVSRMNEGQVHLNKTNFCIEDLLNTSCNHVIIEGKYEIAIEGDTKLEITADEHLLEQVLVNLVNNAIKYAPDSKIIKIAVENQDNTIKIAVSDKGRGIPPDKLKHLFDRYYRADHSGQQYSGLGLGLYICSEIINRHNGSIGVESELGQGSTFWFTIPMS